MNLCSRILSVGGIHNKEALHAELFKRSEFVVPISLKRHLIDIKFLVVGKIPPRGLCHEEADQQIGYVSNAVRLPDALWDHPDVCDRRHILEDVCRSDDIPVHDIIRNATWPY